MSKKTSKSPEELFNTKTIKRFVEKLELGENGCIEWTGSKDKDGYGRMFVCTQGINQEIKAHRWALGLALGGVIIPDEIKTCHHCDNPGCVHPQHLFPGTQQQNIQDMIIKGRKAKIPKILNLSEEELAKLQNSSLSLKQIQDEYNVGQTTAFRLRSGRY